MMLVLGVITLAAGLAMILAHKYLVGWHTDSNCDARGLVSVAVIKGLLFLLLPPQVEAGFFLRNLRYDQLFYLYMIICLVIGIYLTYGGFASTSQRRPTPPWGIALLLMSSPTGELFANR